MIPTILHSKKDKAIEIAKKKKSVATRGWEEGEIDRQSTGFLGQRNYSVWHFISGYMQLYICQNPWNGHPNVNYGLQMIRMHQCEFISDNKCTTLVGDVDSGGARACLG